MEKNCDLTVRPFMEDNSRSAYGAVMPPIYQTSTYAKPLLVGIKDLNTAAPIIPLAKHLKNLWQVLKTESTA